MKKGGCRRQGRQISRLKRNGTTPALLQIDRCSVSAVSTSTSVGYADGAYWIKAAGTAGTEIGTNGTADNPCPWANALTMNATQALNRFRVVNGESIELTATADNYTMIGTNWNLNLSGESIDDISVTGAHVTGIGTATATNQPHFTDCFLGAVTLPPCVLHRCGIGESSGQFTGVTAGQYVLHGCYSMVPGSGTPTFVFTGTGDTTGINNRGWTGGSHYTLDSDCTVSHEVLAGGGQTFVTGGANVELRGICRSVTLTLTGAGTVQVIANTGPVAITGTATTTVNLYGTASALTDTSANTTVNDYMLKTPDLGAVDTNVDSILENQLAQDSHEDYFGDFVGENGVQLDSVQPNYVPATAAALTTHNTLLNTVDSNAEAVAVAWANGGRLDLLLDQVLEDTGTTLPASIAALPTDADVLTQINAALDTAISELGVAAPTKEPSIRTGIMLMYMALRNKLVVQTSGTDAIEIYNDAGTKIAAKAISDDGSDYTEDEMA